MLARGLLAAAAVAGALAACPNKCSGQGACGSNDQCTCFAGYTGPDCSLRTCPYGSSWAMDSAVPHDGEECSGRGICDRRVAARPQARACARFLRHFASPAMQLTPPA